MQPGGRREGEGKGRGAYAFPKRVYRQSVRDGNVPGWAGIEVCNRIKRQREPIASTKIGMENVRAMTGDMCGRCEEEVGEGRYRIRVLFPVERI